ncbi:MAG: branched-chain amino acid aminotransferase [Deltaproteobacteria bacterium]|jgi:branched-chain amino acid aminotransferase|nr:branched-chain amino acid aminotransferase [Deltaproteobacteria bacterium]
MNIRYELLEKTRRKSPPEKVTAFGVVRTNHMFAVDYNDGAWHDARIVPYAPLNIMPGAVCLHYGQTIFEGAKAFQHPDGNIHAWRFDLNAERMNASAKILMMPQIPEDLQMEGLMRLLDIERDWCPTEPESSMYIRPFMLGTEDCLGVKASKTFSYYIMLSPSSAYYAGGFNHAVTLLISTKYHRAVSGGTGAAKTGGNYAASLVPAEHAFQQGAGQVLYLDAGNKYLEEAGTMNHYHILEDGTIIIPPFSDSVLKSTTSMSILDLAKMGKCKARLDAIELEQFLKDIKSGKIIEAGGFGTAAVVSPVGKYILEDGSEYIVGDGGIGKYSRQIYELYSGMQVGAIPAPEGWLKKVERFEVKQ